VGSQRGTLRTVDATAWTATSGARKGREWVSDETPLIPASSSSRARSARVGSVSSTVTRYETKKLVDLNAKPIERPLAVLGRGHVEASCPQHRLERVT
jgi:hypothetical protein